jgi:thioesterase domain-containing protein/acyl carrier protein
MTLHATGRPWLPVTQCLLPQAKMIAPVEALASHEQLVRTSPVSTNEHAMLRIWEQIFKVAGIDRDSNFFDLGGHSLLLARLQIATQKEFHVQLTAADVFRHPTVAELVNWIDQAKSAATQAERSQSTPQNNPRIVPIQPQGSGRPLFVISQSMIFRTMASELGLDQPVFALQMLDDDICPGKEMVGVEQLAKFYLELIRQVQPSGPYRLAGWCVSGWIAYEIARQLESQNEKVELLMVMDAWAPAYWRKQPKMRHMLMQAIYRGQRFRWVARRLSQSSPADRQLYVRRSLHGMAAAAARNLAVWMHRIHLPVQVRLTEEMRRSEQLEYTASRVYDPGPLQGTVLLFRSEEQPTGPLLAPDMGWAKMLGRSVSVEQLPGDHHEIFDLPGARMMAERAREVLDTGSSTAAISGIPSRNGELRLSTQGVPMVKA